MTCFYRRQKDCSTGAARNAENDRKDEAKREQRAMRKKAMSVVTDPKYHVVAPDFLQVH